MEDGSKEQKAYSCLILLVPEIEILDHTFTPKFGMI